MKNLDKENWFFFPIQGKQKGKENCKENAKKPREDPKCIYIHIYNAKGGGKKKKKKKEKKKMGAWKFNG